MNLQTLTDSGQLLTIYSGIFGHETHYRSYV